MIVMTDEQKALFDNIKTTLRQEVALNSLSGMSDIDSYRNSKGTAKTDNAQRAGANEILTDPNVVAFTDAMKAIAVSDAIMSRQEMLEGLSIIADMTGATITQTTPEKLCDLKDGYGVKLKAMKQLAELTGYDAAIKTENNHIIKASENDW